MQLERIEKVKVLLASALARPPHERDKYLDDACVGDPGLRRDVEYYLSSGEKTEQFSYKAETARLTNPTAEPSPDTVSGQFLTDPRVGKEFGKYIVQKRLAEGGMGIVYLAIDTQLGREVVLKVLPEYFSRDHERLVRFHREARATSLLNHPNIVTVFEIGQLEGCEFIVTEYVEGRTLREKMTESPIPFVELLKIASQIAGALAAAHKAGIIHRDIKPENVMIRPDGYVKVLDFGLAKLTGAVRKTVSGDVKFSQRSFNHTIPGTIMGTAAYMSPEQAEGLAIDARTDIWGFGVLLYEMAAGKLPFDGPTASHTIVAILEQTPEPIEHVSPDLRRIIDTALQKDKALRYQTAGAMLAAIDELKHKLGYVSDQSIAGPSVAKLASSVSQTTPYRKSLFIIPSVLGALLILTLGIYAVIAWLSGPPPVSSNSPAASNVQSVATPTAEPTATAAEPSPAEAAVYVSPTPTPAAAPKDENLSGSQSRPERTERQKPQTVSAPVRTPKPTPKKPKPGQDPNCVFTNSCH
jgi:serine/threonine protein kinase